ncbi:ABC transporter permease [Pontibacillus litoralis]|uniref:ABC transporter permease n=1 Tax=Pontibacillus litoralis JSM 072002 TaxID=1385512 RepID=A0A0A5G1V7_9BACI|nr:ABC transporter permease subunit [Pontibacillus litoralis]KGX85045.1 hypothetical protein N784_11155 [Pontibacillus litoralis JSM 072002]
MFKILLGEWKKLRSQNIILLVVAVFLILNVGGAIYKSTQTTEPTSDNWKMSLASQNEVLQKEIKKLPEGSLMSSSHEKTILINEYRIAENLKPKDSINLWSFAYFSKIVLSFAGLIIISIAAHLVSSEHHWKTINTLMATPLQKWKFISSKILTLFTFTFFVVSLQLLFSLIIGGIAFGGGGEKIYLSVQEGKVIEESFSLVVMRHFFLSAVSLFVVAMIGLTLSTVFRSTALSMAISLFLYLTSGNVTRLIAPHFEGIKYSLFANTNLNMYFNGSTFISGMTLTFSLIVLSTYLLVFLLISIGTFVKREV